jgi:hypothetical protein
VSRGAAALSELSRRAERSQDESNRAACGRRKLDRGLAFSPVFRFVGKELSEVLDNSFDGRERARALLTRWADRVCLSQLD